VDLTNRAVTVAGKKVELTPIEFSLLRLFVQNAGKILTHRQILGKIWGRNEIDNKGYVRVYLAYLRRKLENDPARPELLVTEPGIGYRLAVQ
jgi:two-component system KDP operon response regulator KdpE